MEYTAVLHSLESLPIGGVLLTIFGVTAFVFSIYSAVLLWHWRMYSTGKFTTAANMLVFLSVGIGLLLVMVFSIAWYSLV